MTYRLGNELGQSPEKIEVRKSNRGYPTNIDKATETGKERCYRNRHVR